MSEENKTTNPAGGSTEPTPDERHAAMIKDAEEAVGVIGRLLADYGANRVATRAAILVLFALQLGWLGLLGAVVGFVVFEFLARKFMTYRFKL